MASCSTRGRLKELSGALLILAFVNASKPLCKPCKLVTSQYAAWEPTSRGGPVGSSCTLLKEMQLALAEDFAYWTGLTASGRAQQGDIAELALDDLNAEVMVEVHNQSGGVATGIVHTGELLQVGQAASFAADRGLHI